MENSALNLSGMPESGNRVVAPVKFSLDREFFLHLFHFCKISFFILALVTLFLSKSSLAGNVRSLHTSGETMEIIFLRMGQSTVLRFRDKPRKVVVGNQNYFHIEFIENDVAIQPQGQFKTNLFVYTRYRTYGFLLEVSSNHAYDDLVSVYWKHFQDKNFDSNKAQIQKKEKRRFDKGFYRKSMERRSDGMKSGGPPSKGKASLGSSAPSILPRKVALLGNEVKVHLVKVIKISKRGGYLIDIDLENISENRIEIEDFRISLTQEGEQIYPLEIVFEGDEIPIHHSRRCRVIVNLNQNKELILGLRYKWSKKNLMIRRRFF